MVASWILTGVAIGAVGALIDGRSAWRSAIVAGTIFTVLMLTLVPLTRGPE